MKTPLTTDTRITDLARVIADESRASGLTATTYERTPDHDKRLTDAINGSPRGTLLDPQRRELEAHVRHMLAGGAQ
jgi:hypothetical protein